MSGISFIIITNGKKFDVTLESIQSIVNTMGDNAPYEILVVGDVTKYVGIANLTTLNFKNLADSGNLSAMRNRGAEAATYDTLVLVDDDIIFDINWYANLTTFSLNNTWNVYSCKLLSPDGSRCWDRAVVFEEYQSLVYYWHDKYDKNLYQTGGYLTIKKDVFLDIKFDENITYYSGGLINEDVNFSRRLYRLGYCIDFDPANTVYHKDPSLIQNNHVVIKKVYPEQTSILPTEMSPYEAVYEGYIRILGRVPDDEGLRTYVINSQHTLESIVQILTNSTEYKRNRKKR